MSIEAGTYRAKVVGECVLGTSKNKGTPFIEFYLAISEGAAKGQRARWTGFFTENTSERSIQALQLCGWAGDELSDFADGGLHGLDKNEVEIVVELETYQNDAGEDRTAPRVAWINRGVGFLNVAARMNQDAAEAFGARMRGLVLKVKEKSPVTAPAAKPANAAEASAPSSDHADIPF